MLNRLAIALNIREGEGRLVILLLIHSFFIGITKTFTSTAASAIFIDRFGAQSLPYVYIAVAVVVSLIGFGYTKLESRIAFVPLLVTNLSVLLGGVVLFYLLLSVFPNFIDPAVGLMVWFEVIWAMTSLEFWGLASRLFDLRQGKRLFGLIGSGDVTATIISGFAMSTIVSVVGVENLLFFSMVGLVGSVVMMLIITRTYQRKLARTQQQTGANLQSKSSEAQFSYLALFKNHYTVLIFALAAVAFLGYYVVDNAFYDQAQTQYTDSAQLAAFIGNFLAISNILALIARVFISGPFMERFGLLGGLLSLPVMVLAGGLAVVFTGTIWGTIPIIFWLTTGTKLFDSATRFSLYRSAGLVLYQPLSANLQMRVLTAVESFIEPMAGGVAGILLLFLTTYLGMRAIGLYYILIIIVVVWLAIIFLVNREYKSVLVQALSKRQLGGNLLALADRSSMAIIQQGVESNNVGQAIYSLYILEEIDHESFGSFLRRALRHPAPEVRLDALDRIERNHVHSTLRNVRLIARYEPDVMVRAKALQVLAALGGPKTVEETRSHLSDPNLQIRQGAMVGLLRSGGIEGVLVAGQQFFDVVNSSDPVERRLAAQVLGEVEISSFYLPLLVLLKDEDVTVKEAALLAAGRLRPPQLWPIVTELVSDPALSMTAASALVAGGETVVPEIRKAVTQSNLSRQSLIRFIRILGRIRGDAAKHLLEDLLDYPDKVIQHQVMRSLSFCNYQVPTDKMEQLQVIIHAAVADMVWILTILIELDNDDVMFPLRNALNDEFVQGRDRLFLLLCFIYDANAILQSREILQMSTVDSDKRAYALETLDLLFSDTLKRWLLPLFDVTISPFRCLELLRSEFPQEYIDQNGRLYQIISGHEEWLMTWTIGCALNTVAQKSLIEMQPLVVDALDAPTPFIRETALWTLVQLNQDEAQLYIERGVNDSSPQVSKMAKSLLTGKNGGDQSMISTLEKVFVLKGVDIFTEVPEEALIDVASIMEEVEVREGSTIFEQGDAGTCMYVIVYGQIRIHLKEQALKDLGDTDIFGELALLDTQFRNASATALTDTLLFRLDQGPFYELLNDRSEVARGIIRVLIRRLQALNQQLYSSEEQLGPAKSGDKYDLFGETIMRGILDKL